MNADEWTRMDADALIPRMYGSEAPIHSVDNFWATLLLVLGDITFR